MLRRINTVGSSITKFYPDATAPVLVLSVIFLPIAIHYKLSGRGRYVSPSSLNFLIYDSGYRLDLTQSGTYGTGKTSGGSQ